MAKSALEDLLLFNQEAKTWEEEAHVLPDSSEEVIPPLYLIERDRVLWHPYLDVDGWRQPKPQWSEAAVKWASEMAPSIPLLRAIRARDRNIAALVAINWSRVEVHSCRAASGLGGGDWPDRLPTREEVIEGFLMDPTWWNPGPYFDTILTKDDPAPWDFIEKPGQGHFSQPVLTKVGHVQVRIR